MYSLMVKRVPVLILVTIICLLWSLPPAYAHGPAISADAYSLYDVNADQIIWGKNIHQKRPPASTTKMLTAILTRNYCELNSLAIISTKADRTGGTSIGVKAGQTWRVEDLLKSALARSANDACVALAEYIAGSETLFGMLMTKKAFVLGARESSFTNASGLPSSYHYSSAYDLARIGVALEQDPYLKQLVASPTVDINQPGYPQGRTLSNTNRLLYSYPGATGIKTGTTDAAGNCLVASANREGRNLVSVVLHSNDRYQDSKALLNYGFQQVNMTTILSNREIYNYVRVQNGVKYKLPIRTARDIQVQMDLDEQHMLHKLVSLNYSPWAAVSRDQRLGTLMVYYCGERVNSVPLVATEDIPARRKGIKWLFYPFLK